MRLTTIGSMNANQPSWRIVREWDEIIAATLGLKLKSESRLSRFLKCRIIDKYKGLAKMINFFKKKRNDLSLRFIMGADTKESCFVDKNTIPVIIDFWLEEKDLPCFYHVYKNAPLVIVTNREVYRFLKENDCPLQIEHWALSYPDQYALKEEVLEKEYEFCIFGRPNPFFIRMLDKYCESHPDFTFIRNNGDINHREYIDASGNVIAKDTGRASYLTMIRKTKISCYTTPGLDEAKKDTTRFNQVTPRLFEMLCNGCMVIGHYPDSEDTEWYELQSIVPKVETYQDFESTLDHLRRIQFDYNAVSAFMNKHYTSQRALELIDLLKRHNISC